MLFEFFEKPVRSVQSQSWVFSGYLSLLKKILSNVLATRGVKQSGLKKNMHPRAFLKGKIMAAFQTWGNFPAEKLSLNISNSSALALDTTTLSALWGGKVFLSMVTIGAHMEFGLMKVLRSLN